MPAPQQVSTRARSRSRDDQKAQRQSAAPGALKLPDWSLISRDIHSLGVTELVHSAACSLVWGAGEAMYLLKVTAGQVYAASYALLTRKPPWDTWPLYFYVLMAVTKSTFQRADMTIPRIRLQTSFLYTPVPPRVRITVVRIDVRREELLAPERESMRARNAHGFAAVPAETGENSTQSVYRLTGEWVDYHIKHGRSPSKKVILYFHGGGYTVSSPKLHRGITYRVSKMTGARVFAIEYRLAPEDPFPAAVHDAFAAYLYLTAPDHPAVSAGHHARVHQAYKPRNVIVMGDSAGGGLAMALMIYLRDYVSSTKRLAFGMVGGAMMMSPWVDLQRSSESWYSNSQYDYLPAHPGSIDGVFYGENSPSRLYLVGKQPVPKQERNGRAVDASGPSIEFLARHPLTSPIYADMIGLPPMLIQAGGLEVLRDECRLLAHRASKSGVQVRFELFRDMTHVWQAFPFLPATKTAFTRQQDFFRAWLEKGGRKPQQPPTGADRAENGTGPASSEWFVFDHNCEVSAEAVEVTEAAAASAIKLLLLGVGQHASGDGDFAGPPSAGNLARGDFNGGASGGAGAKAVAKEDDDASQLQTAVDGAESEEDFSDNGDDDLDEEVGEGGSAMAVAVLELAELKLMKAERTNPVVALADTAIGMLASAAISAAADTEARCRAAKELVAEGERGVVRDIEFDKAIDALDFSIMKW